MSEAMSLVEELPEGFAPLDPTLDYVDVTEFNKKLLKAVHTQNETIKLLTTSISVMQKSLIRAHEKLIELEADMGAAGIGPKAEKKSTLILPDRMN